MTAMPTEDRTAPTVVSVLGTVRLWYTRYARRVLILAPIGGLVWAAYVAALVPRTFEASTLIVPNKSLVADGGGALALLAGKGPSEGNRGLYEDLIHSPRIVDPLYDRFYGDDRKLARAPLNRRRRELAERLEIRDSAQGGGMVLAAREKGGSAIADLLSGGSAKSQRAQARTTEVANWLAETLGSSLKELQVTGASKAVGYLEGEIERLRAEASGAESELAEVVSRGIESSAAPDASAVAAQLLSAQAELAKARQQSEAQGSISEWLDGVSGRVPETVVVGETRTPAPTLSALRDLRSDVESRRAQLAGDGATASHPEMIEVSDLLATLDRGIAEIEASGESSVVSRSETGLNSLHSTVTAMKLDSDAKARGAEAQVKALTETRDQLLRSAHLSATIGVQAARLRAEADLCQQALVAAVTQLQQAQARAEAESLGFVVVSAADVSKKVSPSVPRSAVSAAFLSCLIALVAGLWRDARRGNPLCVEIPAPRPWEDG